MWYQAWIRERFGYKVEVNQEVTCPNQIQIRTVSVQFVPEMPCFAFDFADLLLCPDTPKTKSKNRLRAV